MSRHNEWTESEKVIIRAMYERGGTAACRKYLPHRTVKAITMAAQKMGIISDNAAMRLAKQREQVVAEPCAALPDLPPLMLMWGGYTDKVPTGGRLVIRE